MAVKNANDWNTSLSGGYSSGVTSIVVSSTTGAPTLANAWDFCYVRINDGNVTAEDVKVTAINTGTNTLTLASPGLVNSHIASEAVNGTVLTVESERQMIQDHWVGAPVVAISAVTTLSSTGLSYRHICTATSAAYTITLPAASGCHDSILHFQMPAANTKLVTIDGNGSETIDGALTQVMWAGETATLWCDGTSWYKIAGRSLPMVADLRLGTTQTGVAFATPTQVSLDTSAEDNTGLMVDTGNHRITIKRASRYSVQCQVGFTGMNAAGGDDQDITDLRAMLYLNGSEGFADMRSHAQHNAFIDSFCVPNAISQGRSFAAGDLLTMYGLQLSRDNSYATKTLSFIGNSTDGIHVCILRVVEQPTW